jgi:hypothetical integral membrane protein (TIGR02206 family)
VKSVVTLSYPMEQFFTSDYHGAPFQLFGPAHLAFLAVVVLALALTYKFRDRFSPRQRTATRWVLAVWLVANELAFHAWNVFYGLWSVQYHLPLHICSVMVFVSAFMLLTRSYTINEFCYFLGIGAAMQALLTPDAGIYGFPHFRFFQTLIAHGLIVFSAVYMTVVEKFRPHPKSLLRVAVGMNLYLAAVYLVNSILGSNYLYIMGKPATASLIDLLGPWPWYILSMEAIGVAICLLLYLPFFLKDLADSRQEKAAAAV